MYIVHALQPAPVIDISGHEVDLDTGESCFIRDADAERYRQHPGVFTVTAVQPIGTSTDANGNTVLTGADGVPVPLFGPNTLTVGEGGQYTTLQAAIDYIATQPAFLPFNIATGQVAASPYQSGEALSWAQNDSSITLGVAPSPESGTIMPSARTLKLRAGAESYYYPLEHFSNAAQGIVVLTNLSVTMKRIDANLNAVAGQKELYWYIENMFTILLLDPLVIEDVTISANACITFTSLASSIWNGSILQGANFKSGKLRFEDVKVGGKGTSILWATDNTIELEFIRGEVDQKFEDFIYPGCKLGSFLSQYTVWNHQPTNTAGNAISPSCVGDIVIQDIIWNVMSHAAINAGTNDAYLVDKAKARNIFVDGVKVFLKDRFNTFDDISIIGYGMYAMAGKIVVNNVSMTCFDTTACQFSMALVVANLAGCEYEIDRCSIHAPNASGAKKLVRVHSGVASATTVKLGRMNNVRASDATANLTYTHTAGISGTATVASGDTSVVVTHGLGYTPNASDINIVPTLLSSSAKWWITAIGATTFQINVDAAPGAGTATFAWRVAE